MQLKTIQPWYLTTLAVAEQLYDALTVWKQQGSLSVTTISQPFFATFSTGIAPGTYASSTATYKALVPAIKDFADSFVAVVAKYTPSGGGLAEQYSRSNGSPVSAADLTWSYAALLTTDGARKGIVPASWGAKGLTVPAVCERNGGGGNPGNPGGGDPGNPGGGGGNPGGGTVAVTFNVRATTVWGGR